MTRLLLPLALLLLLLAGHVHGDLEERRKELESAEQLLKAKDFAGALTGYEKVLATEPESVAALGGRAESLLGLGKKPEAIAALHQGVQVGEARRTLPSEEGTRLMAMRTRLAELDPASADLEGLLRKHADALATLGGKHLAKDPAAAEATLLRALRFQPDHAAALDRLGRLQRARAGKTVTLFHGRNLHDWSWADPTNWNVKDGLIEGDVLKSAMMIRSNKRFDGDQEIVVEARLSRASTDLGAEYGLEATYEGDDAYLFFGVSGNNVVLSQVRSSLRADRPVVLWSSPLSDLDPPFKPEDWHTYTLLVEGGLLRIALDGKALATVPRPPERDGGYLALLVQGAVVQFRKVEVTPR